MNVRSGSRKTDEGACLASNEEVIVTGRISESYSSIANVEEYVGTSHKI